jgi:hypothetical protein
MFKSNEGHCTLQMKIGIGHKELIRSILRETYTNRELRDFVSLCSSLATPYVNKRMAKGDWILSALSMSKDNIVSDSIADMFERDLAGHFVQIGRFFREELGKVDDCSDEMLLSILRRMIFVRVNFTLLQLLRDADPILGRIIHNLDVALERSKSLEKITRLGESFIAPRNENLLMERDPLHQDELDIRLSRIILFGDSVPAILKKVGSMLVDQQQFRRIIPFVPFALFLKKSFALGAGVETESVEVSDDSLENEDVVKIVEDVCAEVKCEMQATYVGNGKATEDIYAKYMSALRNILLRTDGDPIAGHESHYAYLCEEMPNLTREEYHSQHRAILEYLVRLAKQKLKNELKF